MIRSYGLYWTVDHVDWGVGRKGGQLLGAAKRGDEENVIDFRLQRGIYVLYYDFELVYIGQADKGRMLFGRLKDHLCDHLAERWNRFSWFGTRAVTQAGSLAQIRAKSNIEMSIAIDVLEAVAIAIAEPRLNLERGNWKKSGAVQYFQINFNQPA